MIEYLLKVEIDDGAQMCEIAFRTEDDAVEAANKLLYSSDPVDTYIRKVVR